MAIDKAVDSAALNSMFTSIANAIRAKNGETAQYTPAQMAEAIAAIESGGGGSNIETGTVTYSERDSMAYINTTIQNVKGFAFFIVDTPVNSSNLVSASRLFTGLSVEDIDRASNTTKNVVFAYTGITSTSASANLNLRKQSISTYDLLNFISTGRSSLNLIAAYSGYFPAGTTVRWVAWS